MPRHCLPIHHPPDPLTRLPCGMYVARLIQAREAMGWTRREAAAQIQVPIEVWRAAERGQADPGLSVVRRLGALAGLADSFFWKPPSRDTWQGFLCGDFRKADLPVACSVCGEGDATYLCDWVVGARTKTCDAPLCEDCRARVRGELDEPDDPDGIDYCPEHLAAYRRAA